MGQISLVYKDGKGSCHNTFTRSTIINFICDHSQTGNTVPQYVQESSDCTYMFEWRTSAACPPHQISDCTFKHGDDIFDLSRLARVNDNYERVYNDSKASYIINVCRSLVHKTGWCICMDPVFVVFRTLKKHARCLLEACSKQEMVTDSCWTRVLGRGLPAGSL